MSNHFATAREQARRAGYTTTSNEGVQTQTDAAATLTVGDSSEYQVWPAITADRIVTLTAAGANNGDAFHITRSTGAFNLNVGTGPLKAMPASSWGIFVFNGTAWYLAGYGTL